MMTKKILILTLSLLTITLVSKAQVEIVSGGTSAAYTVAVPGTFVLTSGLQVTFKAHTANSASATLNVSGTGAVSITKIGGSAPLSGSDILTNQIVTVAYDGTNWQMLSAVGSTPAASNDWTTTGNGGTNAATNYIGTSDPVDLSFRTNGVIKARLTQKGQLEILNTGSSTFIGQSAGTNDDLNNRQNVFIGAFAGTATSTGNWNTALGYDALGSNITGTSNTAIGRTTLSYSTGSNNTATGTYSLFWGTTGSGNTGTGAYAGQTIKSGSNNTFLGYNADATDSNLTNATAIGYNAKVGQSNSLVLGGTGADIVNVGIGTTTPNERLHVVGDINVSNAIKLNGDPGTAGQVLTSGGPGGADTWSTPTAPTNYWSPNGSDIFNNNAGAVLVGGSNMDGAYKVSFGKDASSVEKVLSLTNSNNFVGGGTSLGFRSNFGGTMWDQALISGITGAASASGDLAFSVMKNRATSTMVEAMRIQGSTGNIGIGTTAPSEKLEVNGGQIYSIWANPNSIPNVMIRNWNSGTGPGYLNGTLGQVTIVTSDAAEDKYAIQGAAGGNSGNKYGVYGTSMGLGVNYGGRFSANGGSSNYALYAVGDAAGTSNATGTFSTVGGSGSGTTYGIYGQNSSSSTGATYAGYFENFNSTGSIIYGIRSSLTGNAGGTVTKYGIRSDVIGTASSNIGGYFRAVGGTTNHAIQLVDGSEANNRVLASDAAGNATWTDLTALSSGSTAWTRSTPNIYPTTLTDNVGIGTSTPGAYKLNVNGNLGISGDGTIESVGTSGGAAPRISYGFNSSASGGYGAMGVGYTAVASGVVAMALGQSVTASGYSAVAIGQGNTAGGDNSTAIGIGNTASGNNSTAIGINNTAAGISSSAFGSSMSTGAAAANSFGIGLSATTYTIANPNTMAIMGGNVGIGTTSPAVHLDISSTYTGGTGLQLANTGAGGRQWRVVSTGSTSVGGAGKFQIYDNTGGTDMLTIDAVNGGEIGIGLSSTMSGRLHVLNSTATWSTYNNAVYGEVTGTTTSSRGTVGVSNATGTYGIGVYGYSQGTAANNYGVYGYAANGTSTNYAGYFDAGNVYVTNNLGIGVAPSYKLHVQLASTGTLAYFDNNTTTGGTALNANVNTTATGAGTRYGLNATAWYGQGVNYGVYTYGYGGTTSYGIYATSGGATTNYAGYFNAGDVYITNNLGIGTAPAYQLQLSTNSAAKPTSNVWTIASDERLKTNVHDYSEGLKEVLAIHPVWFTYTGEAGMPKETGVGVLAQELQKVAPHMVKDWKYVPTIKEKRTDEKTAIPNGAAEDEVMVLDYKNAKTYLAVDNGAMTYMLINAIKEQQKMIDDLKKEVETLKNK